MLKTISSEDTNPGPWTQKKTWPDQVRECPAPLKLNGSICVHQLNQDGWGLICNQKTFHHVHGHSWVLLALRVSPKSLTLTVPEGITVSMVVSSVNLTTLASRGRWACEHAWGRDYLLRLTEVGRTSHWGWDSRLQREESELSTSVHDSASWL